MSFTDSYKSLRKYFTENELSKFPIDHKFFELETASDHFFFQNLDEIFSTIEKSLGETASNDYVKKLICKSNNSFDNYRYNSTFTELMVLYLVLIKLSAQITSAYYEPVSKTNDKRSEYKFVLNNSILNVEVKALNFTNSFDPAFIKAWSNKSYIYKEFIELTDEKRSLIRNGLASINLNFDLMSHYLSEWRKINKQIKDANKKFNKDETFNVLFMNYNAGLDSKEVLKTVLDPENGILNTTSNMDSIDAIVILSLSEKCYSLREVSHASSNSYIIFNRIRNNREIFDLLSVFGNDIYEEDEGFPAWDIYKIIVFDQLHQYVIVPLWKDVNEVFQEVIEFMLPQEKLTDDFKKQIKELKTSVWHERL